MNEGLDELERHRFFDELNTGYRVLRDDDAAWGGIQEERSAESGSLRDASV